VYTSPVSAYSRSSLTDTPVRPDNSPTVINEHRDVAAAVTAGVRPHRHWTPVG
jgi:hypothetical protein